MRTINEITSSIALTAVRLNNAEDNERLRLIREDAERREREAIEEKQRRDDAYDAFVTQGSECIQFGIGDGCKPHCPVFERGDCDMQEENELAFREAGEL